MLETGLIGGVAVAGNVNASPVAAAGIPVVTLRAGEYPRRLRFDAYRASVEKLIDAAPFDEEAALSGSTLKTWLLDQLSFSELSQCAQSLERPTGRSFAAGYGCVRVRLCTSGCTHLMIGDDIFEMATGEIHIIDYSRPFREVSTSPYEQFGVLLPHAAVGYDPARHPAHMKIGLDTPIGQVLANALSSYRTQLDRVSCSDAPVLAKAFCGLIGGLVFPGQVADATTAPVQEARRHAMRAFIEQNLRDPKLGIAALSRTFGAARATIYRDFAEDGGIDHYVTHRRLERAFIDLAERRAERGAVQAIALSYGFADLGHFSRLFKAQFGATPSDVLAIGGSAGSRIFAGHRPTAEIERTISGMNRIITALP